MLIQEYAEDFQAKNTANQSKLQLSLFEMEQHNLLLIATAYKCMQLKKLNKQKKTPLVGAWHEQEPASTRNVS